MCVSALLVSKLLFIPTAPGIRHHHHLRCLSSPCLRSTCLTLHSSPYLILPYLASAHLTLTCFSSPCLSLPHLTSAHLAPAHLGYQRVDVAVAVNIKTDPEVRLESKKIVFFLKIHSSRLLKNEKVSYSTRLPILVLLHVAVSV